jgi:hypothetical protein
MGDFLPEMGLRQKIYDKILGQISLLCEELLHQPLHAKYKLQNIANSVIE